MADETYEICHWLCDKCGASGHFNHPPNADVYTVINKIRDAHFSYALACQLDLYSVRVSKSPTFEDGKRVSR